MNDYTQKPFVSRGVINDLCAELASRGFTLFSIDKPKDAQHFFILAKAAFPFNPAISGRVHWDAFADSLWGGLVEHPAGKLALVICDATAFRETSGRDFGIAMECLLDAASQVEAEKRNNGDEQAEIRVLVGID
jgi:hypothetical protein